MIASLLRRGLLHAVILILAFAAPPYNCADAQNLSPDTSGSSLRLGIFAFRPVPVMEKMYGSLVEHLNQTVAEVHIAVEYLDQDGMEKALVENRIDLLFTNPSHFVLLRQRNRLTGAIATQVSLERGQAVSALAGVVLTPAARSDLQSLKDLKGKTIAIPGSKFLGGYQAQAFELLQAGIRLPDGAKLINVTGHDKVVATLLAGQADAGFVRTGILESMIRDGLAPPGALKVVNQQNHLGFPFVASTRLYPEWAFAALPHVNERIIRRIVRALLEVEPDSPAARSAGIHGFTVPADYLPVENLARALRLPPFDNTPDFTVQDVWARYTGEILILLGAGALILALTGRLAISNRRQRQLRRKAEEGREIFRRLFADAPHPALIMDQGVFVDFNQAALDLLRVSRVELTGCGPLDLSPAFQPDGASSRTALTAIFARLDQDETFRLDWSFVRPDGSPLIVEACMTPIVQDGRRLVYIGWTDITDRKQAEAELVAANARQAAQTAELRRMNAELEQFAYVASHDLRQPLRSITSYLTLIERELNAPEGSELAEFIGFALGGARKMDRLILDLLSYSRAGRNETPPVPVDLASVIDEAMDNLRAAIDESRASVSAAPGLPIVMGHPGELVRLFQNLIGNAIKYRFPDRPPRIAITIQRNNGQCVVGVRDNGIGIAPENYERVFKIFQRLVTEQQFEGSGIGLAICKKIVENYGGAIRVESEPGMGSSFLITFPDSEGAVCSATVH